MKTPRYTVGSVSGFSGHGGENSKWATIWYVHDSAYGYRVLRDFIGRNAERNARELAAVLEEGSPGVCRGCGKEWERKLRFESETRYKWAQFCSHTCQARYAAARGAKARREAAA